MRIGVVAGEVSGDLLGAGLIKAIRKRIPNVRFEGICGDRMEAEGCKGMFPMEWLSIIGFVEAVSKFPQIRWMRKDLIKHFLSDPPDLFVGIDVPDFNLGVEKQLRAAGIPTIHYVSPTVWAWRSYRIHKIKKGVDHMLTLFPFEAKYYDEHDIPVTFVGHPMADEIEERVDKKKYRKLLQLPEDKTIIALLPGSRRNELFKHADLFVQTAAWLYQRNSQLHFVAPFASRETRLMFDEAIDKNLAQDLPITQLDGHSRDAMAASDIVLLASGTATLEAALLKRLMVVTYKLSFLTFWLVKLFVHIKLYSLPNNLAGRELVPELIQRDAVPEKLGRKIEHYLRNPDEAETVLETLRGIHAELRRNASEQAADAILRVLNAQTARG